jgi:hypothetical protein
MSLLHARRCRDSTTRLELRMSHPFPRPFHVIAVFASAVLLIGAAQAPVLKGGFFKANNGTNVIGIDFDTTGALNVTLDGQAFSQSTWQTNADTVTFGPVTGPEGYGCAAGARYLWSIKDNTASFTRLSDDCEVRIQSLTALAWTRG